MKKELLAVAMLLFAGGNLLAQPHVNDGTSYLMNQPLDMSTVRGVTKSILNLRLGSFS